MRGSSQSGGRVLPRRVRSGRDGVRGHRAAWLWGWARVGQAGIRTRALGSWGRQNAEELQDSTAGLGQHSGPGGATRRRGGHREHGRARAPAAFWRPRWPAVLERRKRPNPRPIQVPPRAIRSGPQTLTLRKCFLVSHLVPGGRRVHWAPHGGPTIYYRLLQLLDPHLAVLVVSAPSLGQWPQSVVEGRKFVGKA